MDEIIVIADGAICERGTYKELLTNKGECCKFMLQVIITRNVLKVSFTLKCRIEIFHSLSLFSLSSGDYFRAYSSISSMYGRKNFVLKISPYVDHKI